MVDTKKSEQHVAKPATRCVYSQVEVLCDRWALDENVQTAEAILTALLKTHETQLLLDREELAVQQMTKT